MTTENTWDDTAWRKANPGYGFRGTAAYDSPEARVLRVRAKAQATNLANAIESGAFPGALILRAKEAAEAATKLAELIMDEQRHP